MILSTAPTHFFLYHLNQVSDLNMFKYIHFQNNLMNTGGGNNNPNMTALQVQKYLNQGPHGVTVQPVGNASALSIGFGQNASNTAVAAATSVNLASNSSNQPSGQQIRMLGQQIQLAIHSGFISSQILTQPLTQTTLNLLNQLLSNIKVIQQT